MITIREANKSDAKLFFNWVNDKAVRKNSINSNKVMLDSHFEWFEGKLRDVNSNIYLAEFNGIPCGQVRFDYDAGFYIIDYSIDTNYRGKGLAKIIVESAIKKLVFMKKEKLTFIGKVKTSNIPSCKIFNQLGFNELESEYANNIELRVFTKEIK